MIDREKVLESAQKYVLKGQSKKAIKEYLKLIEASPKDKRLYLKLADLYLKEGESEKAVREYLKLADLYREEELNFRAISVYKKILSIDPKLVEPLHKLAKLYLKEGLAGSAKTYYQSVLEIKPDDREALEALRVFETQPRPKERPQPFPSYDYPELETSQDKRPVRPPEPEAPAPDKDAETHYHLGIGYKEMELLDYAISEFELASATLPMRFDCYVMLGDCFKEKGDYDRSIEYYKMASGMNGLSTENLARVHFNLGAAYEANGMLSEALETFKYVLKLDQSFSEANRKIRKLQSLQK